MVIITIIKCLVKLKNYTLVDIVIFLKILIFFQFIRIMFYLWCNKKFHCYYKHDCVLMFNILVRNILIGQSLTVNNTLIFKIIYHNIILI